MSVLSFILPQKIEVKAVCMSLSIFFYQPIYLGYAWCHLMEDTSVSTTFSVRWQTPT